MDAIYKAGDVIATDTPLLQPATVAGFFPDQDAFTTAIDAAIGDGNPYVAAFDEARMTYVVKRQFAATCPRCAGPATAMLTSIWCERVGGCKTVDERIGEPTTRRCRMRGDDLHSVRGYADGSPHVFGTFEDAYCAWGLNVTRYHPTRDGAVALWREAAIAAERAK